MEDFPYSVWKSEPEPASLGVVDSEGNSYLYDEVYAEFNEAVSAIEFYVSENECSPETSFTIKKEDTAVFGTTAAAIKSGKVSWEGKNEN